MRLSIVTVAAACVLRAGGLEAQPETAPGERRAHDVYVLSGCLEADPEATEEFVLTDATANGAAPPEGDTGAPQTTYQLRPVSGITASGVEADELRRHVGFLVEVTVRPQDPAPAPAPDISPGAVAEPVPQFFTVTAVTRQGGECG
jgi:hypothetical protein